MSNIARANQTGNCPYCQGSDFESAAEEVRNETQLKQKCNDCGRWSVRNKVTGCQLPLQDSSDKDSSPATIAKF